MAGITSPWNMFPGRRYRNALRTGKRLSTRKSCELVSDIARGLQHAHQRGLIHRDVKPSNVLLDERERARITDFGLVLQENDPADDLAYAGTPAYMSPEQARGEGNRVDGRSDVFSLGAVFYRLLTGRQPFEGLSVQELCEQIVSAPPLRPRSIVPELSEELERICLKAIAKAPSERYATAGELADDLDSWLRRRRNLEPGAATADVGLTGLVPRGLHPYEGSDARYFLELVPGPRDRSGLPQVVRFWKRLIEGTNPDKSFRIGVIHGPTGSGKTSLIRSGLLPKLGEHVIPVSVIATGQHTESVLCAKLQETFRTIPRDLELADVLSEVKGKVAEQPGAKVLLVIDQFEQWLHFDRDLESSRLVEALRCVTVPTSVVC